VRSSPNVSPIFRRDFVEKVIYSSSLRVTTKGDSGRRRMPPLSALHGHGHAYRRLYDCARTSCDRPCCVTEQMHVRPIIVVTTMTMTTWRMTLRSCQSRGTAGTSRPRLVTEPSGRDSSDGNHAHKSRNLAPSKTTRSRVAMAILLADPRIVVYLRSGSRPVIRRCVLADGDARRFALRRKPTEREREREREGGEGGSARIDSGHSRSTRSSLETPR